MSQMDTTIENSPDELAAGQPEGGNAEGVSLLVLTIDDTHCKAPLASPNGGQS